MFVPGVNGSVIPSAPSGSRLKGAYKNSKNSKKRKMPNGGSTGLGMALEAATYVPGPIGTYASGASALANLYQGDYVGAGLDALNMATFGTAKGLMGVARAANTIRPYSNLAVNAAQASRTVNRVAKKVAPVTRAAGTVNEFTSSPYNATMRVPQRDNAQVQFRPNPNMRRMPNGGSVLSMGDYDVTTAPKKGNYLLPDINRPGYIDSEGARRTEYKMGVNIDGKETLLPTVVGGKQLTEDEAINRYYKTGLNMGKFNTPQEADYASRLRTAKYNMLENPIRFQASQLKNGGKASNDKQMVDGVASILRRVEDKQNRLKLANQLSKQFNREKVKYDLPSFLAKSKVKK
jgi:hypothetical protein